jgi:hypothetical protein
VLVVTPSERQSGEFLRKASGFVRKLGERASSDGWMHYVPKRDLVAGLQLAFEKREIAIASEVPLMSEVMRELMTMQVKVTLARALALPIRT